MERKTGGQKKLIDIIDPKIATYKFLFSLFKVNFFSKNLDKVADV